MIDFFYYSGIVLWVLIGLVAFVVVRLWWIDRNLDKWMKENSFKRNKTEEKNAVNIKKKKKEKGSL